MADRDTEAHPDVLAVTGDDLRAAVAAGHITESQAVNLTALAARRAGIRIGRGGDDEPFELFRGFAEIFISVGLIIGIVGMCGIGTIAGNPVQVAIVGVFAAPLLAWYFTRTRRMVLPSIVLTCGFALALMVWVTGLAADQFDWWHAQRLIALISLGVTALALCIWYWVFRLPFTMFLIGLCLLASIFVLCNDNNGGNLSELLALGGGSYLGIGTLVFGLLAMTVGVAFDMRDPHRLGRASSSAFWLHLLAASAIVNTLAITALNAAGGPSYMGLSATLALITLIALILDRRSFLTAGLGYLAWLIWSLSRQTGSDLDWPEVLIQIGIVVTASGAFWTKLRSALMRFLPAFPGKDRLPPYDKGGK